MEFYIVDTFQDSLNRLTNEEKKAVKTTAFDLQMNPAQPGLHFHRLDRARDKKFWSLRVSGDLRIIVHRSDASLMLCYVDHHDRAYEWAEHRRLEAHPRTGVAQIVEIRETVQDVFVPVPVQAETDGRAHAARVGPVSEPALFDRYSDEDLLGYGVPTEWIADVKQVTSSRLLALCDHLPAEASEALLEIATGGTPRKPQPVAPSVSPFEHPDAQRRFRVMSSLEELQRALEFPWEKWTIFLHPDQRQWVERQFNGPARVSGSAGTGKTIVALHRAVHLARANPDSVVLLATWSETLASALQVKLKRLLGGEPRLGERIEVMSLPALGQRLYGSLVGPVRLADPGEVRNLMQAASNEVEAHRFSLHFLMSEWEHVVDAWQLKDWEAYRDVTRLGRKTRLPEAQRRNLWSIFEKVQGALAERGMVTQAAMFTALAEALPRRKSPPFDFAVVDEAQDAGIPHLRFFAALGADRPNALFFAGDWGQRIFQQSFAWKSLGVDVRGRSRTLRVNYRTSHQIRTLADRLLGAQVVDADGIEQARDDTVSVFNGPTPTVCEFDGPEDETEAIAIWLSEQAGASPLPHEYGIFVRSKAQLERAESAVKKAGLPYRVLDDRIATASGHASICTMNLAKGLEFRSVVVMACDDDVIPLQARIESVGDQGDLQEVYDTERHLLYVACTRARDNLLVTSVSPASEFLADMQAPQKGRV